MKIDIDISIFTAGGSYGHATGALELPAMPSVGEAVSFASPRIAGAMLPRGFTGTLKVTDRIVDPSGTTLVLEDLTLGSVEEARAVSKYLADGFEISVDPY